MSRLQSAFFRPPSRQFQRRLPEAEPTSGFPLPPDFAAQVIGGNIGGNPSPVDPFQFHQLSVFQRKQRARRFRKLRAQSRMRDLGGIRGPFARRQMSDDVQLRRMAGLPDRPSSPRQIQEFRRMQQEMSGLFGGSEVGGLFGQGFPDIFGINSPGEFSAAPNFGIRPFNPMSGMNMLRRPRRGRSPTLMPPGLAF